MAIDIISVTQSISENSNLVSKYGRFELGFFSPGSSKRRYVGIWYKNIPGKTVVWVAKHQNSINDFSRTSMMNRTTHLILLVLRNEKDDNSQNYLWQNFDHLSGTLLPGMKLGWDLKTDLDWHLVSWTNPDDPSSGNCLRGNSYNLQSIMWKGLKNANGERNVKMVVEVLAVVFMVCGMFLLAHYICEVRARKGLGGTSERLKNQNNEDETENMEVLFFNLDKIIKATSNFSSGNKLEEGSFEPVYKTLEWLVTFNGDQSEGNAKRMVGT
ncbi:G-type lectin S-receptor-like serine/threonine-protein kinase At4g27290 [Ziziphus jujuba]|uniref:G-type lectin S-receptor-like serine/threonine-protein kinase At4g27290 n=1 Tax=Ziziphus jujuba TaxID=326968 RepID=A0ABM4A422_ZIZJJ|nr:G-type lectin S-receptor-like serine/threonine-protein kinase At4g27290 [Ziziphus jujuba]